MTITLGSLDTGTALHGSFKTTPWASSRAIQTFFGLDGAYVLTGGRHTREISTWLLMWGYSTHANLQAAVATANEYINAYGTVTWTVGADVGVYTQCIYNGFEVDEHPWLDASGVNGWMVQGMLKFTQVKP